MSKTKHLLSIEQLATVFTQLKRLESAGLPAVQAFTLLTQLEPRLKTPFAKVQHALKAGRPISEAGFKAGIFNNVDRTLIHAAETSGRLMEVYGQLATHYTDRNSRIKKLLSRLYFPLLTLILSLFLQPLPALVAAEISGFTYLQLSVGRLLIMSVGVFLLLRLPEIVGYLGIERSWHRLQLRIPAVANWIIKRQINGFLFILAMMLEGGLAFSEALPKAVASIKNSYLRESFKPALKLLPKGASVVDTLAKVSVINALILQILHSNEQSGTLAKGILHFTQQEAESIALQDDALAEWLPRLLYSIIAMGIAHSILSTPLVPEIPASF